MSEANIDANAGSVAPTPPPPSAPTATPASREPDHFRRVLVIWVVLSVIGMVACIFVLPYILPPTASHRHVLELRVNRPVQSVVTSKDVLHGFAVRTLGVRVDANPGQVTTTPYTTPTEIGQYPVVCVELCGLYHSYMWSSLKVVDQSTFNDWITSQGGHP